MAIFVSATADGVGNIYLVTLEGNVYWYRDVKRDGSPGSLEGPRTVGTDGWNFYRYVFSGDDGIVYAVNDRKNEMYEYRDDSQNGSQLRAVQTMHPNFTWWRYYTLFNGGPNVVYGVFWNGNLYRIQRDGASFKSRPTLLAEGWQHYQHVFSGTRGILYAVTRTGALLFFRDTGTALEGPTTIATSGWENAAQIFPGGEGIIYVITSNGELQWYRDVKQDGSPGSIEGPRTISGGWQLLSQRITNYAPQVRLYPGIATYRPSSVEWYLERVGMKFALKSHSDPTILKKGQVNPVTLVSQLHDNQASESSPDHLKSDFYLDIPSDHDAERTKRGNLAGARCYSHVVLIGSYRKTTAVQIQYWFFYPYNGDVYGIYGAHEGDWETISVEIDPASSEVRRVYFAQHAGGTWYKPDELKWVDSHPVVYSAQASHASYPTAGIHWQDHTADGGPKWETWNVLEQIHDGSPPWVRYNGRWGGLQAIWPDGPVGPGFHTSWYAGN